MKEIRIPVNRILINGLIEMFEELRVFYNFEDNVLIMDKSQAIRFLSFMDPINEFCEQLRKAVLACDH